MGRAALAALWLWAALLGPAVGQGNETFVSPILTLDQERLFADPRLSGLVTGEIEQRRRALAEENRVIETELVAEELELTERRPNLPATEFKVLADAFAEKVATLRTQQDAKFAELQRFEDASKQEFIGQIVAAIAAERGALIVIDRRNVVLSAGAIDITDEAVRRGIAALEQTPPPTPEPEQDQNP